jgi:putative RecB family exonuclease
MPKRVQSASSINSYKQCPRKYYYVYIEELPTKPSIHTLRGNIVHSVLEDFYSIDPAGVTKENCRTFLQEKIINLLVHHWQQQRNEFAKLNLTPTDLAQFKEESVVMLLNWLNHFLHRVYASHDDFEQAFRRFIPQREQFFESAAYMVRGYIDAIENIDGKVHIIDYKTSKDAHISDEYRLQMAIYLLLYQERHHALPHKASFFFLKHKPVEVPVEPALVELAKREVAAIHARTSDTDKKEEYPMQPGPLCRFCDFNGLCFSRQQSLGRFVADKHA